MGSQEDTLKVFAIICAGIATITDMRAGKVFNWLTLPMILVGWLLNLYFYGLPGFGHSLGATFLGIALYLGFAIVGAFGMGDVKLMAGIGSLAGVLFTVNVFLFTSAIGLFHAAMIQYLNHGRNAFTIAWASIMSGAFKNKTIQKENETDLRYKYYLGPDIFLATIAAFFYPVAKSW